MLLKAHTIPYAKINAFSPLILDYLSNASKLQQFYSFSPTDEGLRQAIEEKKQHVVDRNILADELQKQYATVASAPEVSRNIELLRESNTFTVCTAHQPNLFTGPLYFMYKIIHAIKLAKTLAEKNEGYHFVPVYYMGCEDADFDELNHTYVDGKKIEWQKVQSGAVGRMVVDKGLLQLVDELEGQLYLQQYAQEVIGLLKRCYTEGKDIQTATFELVNELYGRYGLIVLIPDNATLKREMLRVFEDDIFEQTSSSIVEQTSALLKKDYKVQANPREINLFYLKENIRERLVKKEDGYAVNNTNISFTEKELRNELEEHPERFSPNVILRGLFQETILPNIAFIGGGGELAYWLQLKGLFQHYGVPYPVLVLRNSFLVLEEQQQQSIAKLRVSFEDIFLPELDLLNLVIEREGKKPQLNGELDKIEEVYAKLAALAVSVDAGLSQHVAALKTKTVKQLLGLEKKLLRAERKKHEAAKNKITRLKEQLFPKNNLQERVENFSSYYAKWGGSFIDELYKHSFSLEQQFVVLTEA
jgi:bacillithiol biosynthesis cysteine-adding enzyme BshC